jgi:hypothetical protein
MEGVCHSLGYLQWASGTDAQQGADGESGPPSKKRKIIAFPADSETCGSHLKTLPPAMGSSLSATQAAAHGPTAQPILLDDVLADIFLQLHREADLAALSAACSTFRRDIFSHRFLCRFRSIHPPPALGFLMRHRIIGTGVFQPAQQSHGFAKGGSAPLWGGGARGFGPARCWGSRWVRRGVEAG